MCVTKRDVPSYDCHCDQDGPRDGWDGTYGRRYVHCGQMAEDEEDDEDEG